MQIVVDSLLIDYSKIGSGKNTIVLLHGWGDSRQTFEFLEKELVNTYTVISLDLPGFGKSQAPDTAWDLADYASIVSKFLQKLNIREVYALVGHSNGGALAIFASGTGVINPDKLVLIAASGIRNRQKGKRLAIKLVAKTGKVATFWLPKNQKQKLRKRLHGSIGSDMFVAPHLQETYKKTVRHDVQAEASKITKPTLLIYGENDKDTPPVYGEIYHNLIHDSVLEIIGGTGHFVHKDKPAQTLKLIEDFLR